MALAKCSECGGTVSSKATTCPHCGYDPSAHCWSCLHYSRDGDCDETCYYCPDVYGEKKACPAYKMEEYDPD